jgi:hypothetical protein
MNKLSVKPKNWLLASHVAFIAIWAGTVLSMVLILLVNRNTANGDELYALNRIVKLLDDFVVIPTAIATVLTGGLLCGLTVWGFVKFYWVIVKWITTLALVIFGMFWLFPWSNAMTSISNTERLKALENPLYVFDDKGIVIGSVTQVLCLLVIIAISVLKPWGRRNTIKN